MMKIEIQPAEIYTATEVADAVGVSRQAVHNARHAGHLPAQEKSFGFVFRGEDVLFWNATRRNAPIAETEATTITESRP
jgi:hypothetical protein